MTLKVAARVDAAAAAAAAAAATAAAAANAATKPKGESVIFSKIVIVRNYFS